MVAIIDLDSILFAAAWPNKIPDGYGGYIKEDNKFVYEDKTDDEIRVSVDSYFTNILNNSKAKGYIAFVKNKNTGKHRYEANKDYKSNRPKEKPKWWDFTRDYSIEKWGAIPTNEIEVDDAVNISRLLIKDSYIVAVDKDLLNLEGTHYNWKTNEWVTINKELAFKLFWADMITGQSGDGLKGIPGKGKVYASKIELDPYNVLKEYINYFGEEIGIQEYYKNYSCLKILDNFNEFELPNIIEWKTESIL